MPMKLFSLALLSALLALPSFGAIDIKKGSFTLSTCAATCTQDITDVGFQPKGYILWVTNLTAEGTGANACFAIGAVGDNGVDFSSRWESVDNVGTTIVVSASSTSLIPAFTSSGCTGSVRVIVHSSFLSNGFRLSYTTAAGTAVLVHYLAFGGADLTDIGVTQHTMSTGITGNVAYTGVGFQADFGLFLSPSDTGVSRGLSVGSAVSSSARWATNLSAVNGVSMTGTIDAGQYQRTDSVVLSQSAFAEDTRADFVAWGSDGFTLNVTNSPTASFSFLVIAFKGGSYQVGETSKCTTGSCTDTNSTTFTPKGVFLAARNAASGTTVVADAVMSVGAMTSGNEGTTWAGMKDATLNTQADSVFNTTKALSLYTAGTPTLSDEADATLNSSDFQMTWTTSSATAKQYLWAAFGDAPAAPTCKNLRTLLRAGC